MRGFAAVMSSPLAGKIIVLGVTGSIAAYKAAELISQLRKQGAEVHPVLTKGGAEFITPLTLQTLARQPVAHDLWKEGQGWQPGHVDLADRADLPDEFLDAWGDYVGSDDALGAERFQEDGIPY